MSESQNVFTINIHFVASLLRGGNFYTDGAWPDRYIFIQVVFYIIFLWYYLVYQKYIKCLLNFYLSMSISTK